MRCERMQQQIYLRCLASLDVSLGKHTPILSDHGTVQELIEVSIPSTDCHSTCRVVSTVCSLAGIKF